MGNFPFFAYGPVVWETLFPHEYTIEKLKTEI